MLNLIERSFFVCPYSSYIHEQAKIFKALGHPHRLIMVDALRKGSLCVCELQELVQLDISTVSRHLQILREAHIVSSEKRGKNIYYTLELKCLDTFLNCSCNAIQLRQKPLIDK